MRLSDIHAEDVVLADKKGRRVFGLVLSVDDEGVAFRPLTPNTTYRRASAREIVGHWRKTGRPRPDAADPATTDRQLALG